MRKLHKIVQSTRRSTDDLPPADVRHGPRSPGTPPDPAQDRADPADAPCETDPTSAALGADSFAWQSAPIPSVILGSDGAIRARNRAAQALWQSDPAWAAEARAALRAPPGGPDSPGVRIGDTAWRIDACPTPDGRNRVLWLTAQGDAVARAEAAEHQLRIARWRLDAVRSCLGFWELDMHTGRVTWNTELLLQLGYPDAHFEEPAGDVYRHVHPDDVPRMHEKMVALIRDGGENTFRARIVRPDGSACWFQASSLAIRGDDGRTQRVVGTLRDIGAEVDAHEAREDLLDRLQLALETAQIGVWEWDARTDQFTSDRRTRSLHGQAIDGPVFGREQAYALVRPADRAEIYEKFRAAAQDGTRGDIEVPFQLPGGEVRWIRETFLVRRAPDGSLVSMVGTASDLTERRAVEASIRSLAERLTLATSGAGIGIWEYDASRRALEWDARCFALAGASPADGVPAFDCLVRALLPDDFARLKTELREALDQGRDLDAELRFLMPNRELAHVTIKGVPVRTAEGSTDRVIGVAWDATARRQAESLRLQKARVEAADQAKTVVLARLAEDIIGPLTTLSSTLSPLLASASLPQFAQLREQLARVSVVNEDFLARLNNLLDLARLEVTDAGVVLQPLPLEPIVREALARLGEVARRHGVEVVPLPADAADLHVWSEPQRLHRIVVSLLDVAVRRSPIGGRLALSLKSSGSMRHALVIDTAVVTSATAPIAPVDEAPRAADGLDDDIVWFLAQRLAEPAGASIDASTGPGGALAFTLALRAASVERTRGGAPSRWAAYSTLPAPRASIVCVGGDARTRATLRRALAAGGHAHLLTVQNLHELVMLSRHRAIAVACIGDAGADPIAQCLEIEEARRQPGLSGTAFVVLAQALADTFARPGLDATAPPRDAGVELLAMPPDPEHFQARMRRWGLARPGAEAAA